MFRQLLTFGTAVGFSISCQHGGHHRQHKKMWKMMDKDSNSVVTKEEFDQAHAEMFSKMDGNGDNQISLDEAKSYAKTNKCDHGKKDHGK